MDQCLGIGDEACTLVVLQFSVLQENTIKRTLKAAKCKEDW